MLKMFSFDVPTLPIQPRPLADYPAWFVEGVAHFTKVRPFHVLHGKKLPQLMATAFLYTKGGLRLFMTEYLPMLQI